MEVTLTRKTFLNNRTFGELSTDGVFLGHTLEDKVRDNEPFILGETAIPYGRYRLIVSFSNRFQKQMIQVINVRGGNTTFHGINIDQCGIRIHGGNTEKDSLGCPLLGAKRDGDNKIYECERVNNTLISKVKAADKKEEVYLNITK